MNRSPCPTCSCGFGENNTLFPDITLTRATMLVSSVRSADAFRQFLKNNGIGIQHNGSEWIFPPGICRRVRVHLLRKMQELNIPHPKNNLPIPLLPATGPDDEIEPSKGSGIPLQWSTDDIPLSLLGIKSWEYTQTELLINE